MKINKIREKIVGEEYFVHSYGDDEFYKFWDSYTEVSNMNNGKLVNYDFSTVIYDFIKQLNSFETKKNFVVEFKVSDDIILDPKGLIYSLSYMNEVYYNVASDVTKIHYVRIYGEYESSVEEPLIMQIKVNDTKEIFNYILNDNTNDVSKFVGIPTNFYGNIQVSDKINTKKIIVNGNELLGERNRSIIAYDGANYLRDGQELALNFDGYDSGKFEKLVYKFSKYDTETHVPIDAVVSTYITYNNATTEAYDGIYNTNCHLCSTSNESTVEEFITKAFNLDTDGVLTGYSSSDSLTNKIVLRSVSAIIDEEYFGTNILDVQDTLKEYATISTKELDANVDKIYLKDAKTAYNIYSLNEEELAKFEQIYKSKTNSNTKKGD